MADPLGLISGSGGVQPNPVNKSGGGGQNDTAFKDMLLKNIEQVNKLQQDAHQAIEDLNSGQRNDVANVMIAKQKADVAFKALLAVRNKMMDAYQEIKEVRV